MSIQIFDPTPRPSQAGMLGQALGVGLGKLSERKQREQQQSQLARALFGEEAEQYGGLPAEQQLRTAQLQQQRDIEFAKLAQPKAQPGGVTAQPVPEDVSNAMADIVEKNPEATADQLKILLDKKGVPPIYSNSLIENRRREQEIKATRDIKEGELTRKERLEFHKESAKYDEALTKKSDSAERKLKAIDRQRKLQPEITSWDRFVSAAFGGTRFEDLFKAQSAQEFDSLALPMIEGQKENFGVRLSDADLRLIMQKIATSTKNPEANKSIMEWQRLESELDIKRRKIGDQIRKDNNGLRPLDYDAQIRQRMNEKFGDEIQAKADEIMALEDDPEMLAKIGRTNVPPGTPLTTEVIDKYLDMTGKNSEEAERLAREDGYEF